MEKVLVLPYDDGTFFLRIENSFIWVTLTRDELEQLRDEIDMQLDDSETVKIELK